MEDRSMIEFANIGIRVGYPNLLNYGGGIISIKDSKLKDNITGIRFDPYIRSTGGEAELYNRAIVSNNVFSTTEDWIDDGGLTLQMKTKA